MSVSSESDSDIELIDAEVQKTEVQKRKFKKRPDFFNVLGENDFLRRFRISKKSFQLQLGKNFC